MKKKFFVKINYHLKRKFLVWYNSVTFSPFTTHLESHTTWVPLKSMIFVGLSQAKLTHPISSTILTESRNQNLYLNSVSGQSKRRSDLFPDQIISISWSKILWKVILFLSKFDHERSAFLELYIHSACFLTIGILERLIDQVRSYFFTWGKRRK